MDTMTACGQWMNPPPDPLWLPDSDWPWQQVSPRHAGPWADDGGPSAYCGEPADPEGSAGILADAFGPNPQINPDSTPDFIAVLRVTGSGPGPGLQLPDGLSGYLGLRSVAVLNQELTGAALQGLKLLDGWAAAARARLIHRQHLLMVEGVEQCARECAGRDAALGQAPATPEVDRSLALRLTVTELAALLGIPEGTAHALVEESEDLCGRCPDTLAMLERAEISPAQACTILEQTRSLLSEELVRGESPAGKAAHEPDAGSGPGEGQEPVPAQSPAFPPGAARAFEQELLHLAPGLTNAQLLRKARRLRERSYPETIVVRHRTAFGQRRVWFQPQPDGMGHLTAYLPADKGQNIFGALTGAARGEQALGDPRSLDQLRTDILASLLLHTPEPWIGEPWIGEPAGDTTGHGAPGFNVPPLPSGTVAEIMVLINADTLFGVDDAAAELAGYGPISADSARRLARTARRWTGLAQDPRTGQILEVGRRRKVPAGLRRWLQARDQTCRFPGCSVGAARTEADHTIAWAHGGPTEHWNLANLCKKHHRLKTLGHWKARQVSPGVLEWISPLGRRYQTQPELMLMRMRPPEATGRYPGMHLGRHTGAPPGDSDAAGESPPPF